MHATTMTHGTAATAAAAAESSSSAASSTTIGAGGPLTSAHYHRQAAHHRPSSSTGSFSSASVITAKRASSVSTGGRSNSHAASQRQSTGEGSLIALRVGRENGTTSERRRRKSVAVDSSERMSTDGLDNLNRWSHSTASSMTSNANPNASARRSRASSGAVLPGLLYNKSISPQKTRPDYGFTPPDTAPPRTSLPRPISPRRLSNPANSPPDARRRPLSRTTDPSALTALPPLHTTPSLTDPNDVDESPSTLATIATPSTAQFSSSQEYFHGGNTSPRPSTVKGKQPVMIRNNTGPVTVVNASRLQQDSNQPQQPTQETTSRRYQDEPVKAAGSRSSKSNTGNSHGRSRPDSKEYKRELLAKALENANTAVLLDNAQDFESALRAYDDACNLLSQVMMLSEGVTDKRKLESIRVTYTNRIDELRQMDLFRARTEDEKALPEIPTYEAVLPSSPVLPPNDVHREYAELDSEPRSFAHSGMPSSRDAMADRSNAGYGNVAPALSPAADLHEGEPSGSSRYAVEKAEPVALHGAEPRGRSEDAGTATVMPPHLNTTDVYLPPPEDNTFMPRPLSPRRPSVTDLRAANDESSNSTGSNVDAQSPARLGGQAFYNQPNKPLHIRDGSNVSMSWLDTIDESGRSSRSSSIHSRSPERGIHRKPLPDVNAGIATDFDAAFDAAVEAAYDEGFEPDLDVQREIEPASRRHAPQESVAVRSSMIQEIWSPSAGTSPAVAQQQDDDPDDDEEERMLDEITQDFAQTFNFDLTTKSALPRQSDSSGYSRSTWQSSLTSDRATAGSSLSTVAEDTLPARFTQKFAATSPSLPAPVLESQPTLAPPTQYPLARPSSATSSTGSNVRSRRLSGNAKQLKIETSKPESRNRASTYHLSGSPFREDDEQKAAALGQTTRLDDGLEPSLERTVSENEHEKILKSPPSLSLMTGISDESRPMTARTATTTNTEPFRSFDGSESEDHLTTRPALFRKNKSSVSLREHTVLLSPTDSMPPVIPTPMSSTFMQYGLKQRPEGPLTSQRARFPSLASAVSDGSHASRVPLFDTSLASSTPLSLSPRSPPGMTPPPPSVESCPNPSLLRPFWLMRAILSTLTHPKGGFLTTRLFVPREVWQTPNVKLKSVEDKVANCDLLTAALGQLSGVDTYDADATLVELQEFEGVMDRVQSALSKKLGSDVGVHGLGALFKDAAANAAASGAGGGSSASDAASMMSGAGSEKSKSKEGKSGYLNSWRKLRSKSSGTPLGGGINGGGGGVNAFASGGRASDKDAAAVTMPTVPMTSFVPVDRRGQKKSAVEAKSLVFEGAHKEYMASLARLFDSVQALDLIARQVEDPGLKATSSTYVGLELSIRHAAEFFGFYICRFVLADLGILLDKYLKRSTEWVLA